jgi:hypothetical protein
MGEDKFPVGGQVGEASCPGAGHLDPSALRECQWTYQGEPDCRKNEQGLGLHALSCLLV